MLDLLHSMEIDIGSELEKQILRSCTQTRECVCPASRAVGGLSRDDVQKGCITLLPTSATMPTPSLPGVAGKVGFVG